MTQTEYNIGMEFRLNSGLFYRVTCSVFVESFVDRSTISDHRKSHHHDSPLVVQTESRPTYRVLSPFNSANFIFRVLACRGFMSDYLDVVVLFLCR